MVALPRNTTSHMILMHKIAILWNKLTIKYAGLNLKRFFSSSQAGFPTKKYLNLRQAVLRHCVWPRARRNLIWPISPPPLLTSGLDLLKQFPIPWREGRRAVLFPGRHGNSWNCTTRKHENSSETLPSHCYVDISTKIASSITERLSANQRALCVYADHSN